MHAGACADPIHHHSVFTRQGGLLQAFTYLALLTRLCTSSAERKEDHREACHAAHPVDAEHMGQSLWFSESRAAKAAACLRRRMPSLVSSDDT